nr:LiaF domain-containing protein [Bacillus subtilis]
MKKPFQLSDLTISGFIGDVKIDLSKAIIAEEESTIVISGLIRHRCCPFNHGSTRH